MARLPDLQTCPKCGRCIVDVILPAKGRTKALGTCRKHGGVRVRTVNHRGGDVPHEWGYE